jgi:hypothetical protein
MDLVKTTVKANWHGLRQDAHFYQRKRIKDRPTRNCTVFMRRLDLQLLYRIILKEQQIQIHLLSLQINIHEISLAHLTTIDQKSVLKVNWYCLTVFSQKTSIPALYQLLPSSKEIHVIAI